MKCSAIASLAIVSTWTVLASGQTVSPGSVFVAEQPAPAPSVIRVDTPSAPKRVRKSNEAAKTQAALEPSVKPTNYRQEPTSPVPSTPTTANSAPIIQPPKDSPTLTNPDAVPMPQVADQAAPMIFGQPEGSTSGYATDMIGPIFPWSKCGSRVCGSVYIETPYIWFDARYLFGWFKKDFSPPLLTTGPVGAANPGALDDPQTTILYDGQKLNNQPYFGGSFNVGGWFDECQYFGGELSYFFFGQNDNGYITSVNGFPGTPGLYLPFENPLRDLAIFDSRQDVLIIGDSNNAEGFAKINSQSQLMGADGHFLFSFCRGMTFRCDALAGVRWLGLDESLTMETNTRMLAPAPFFNGNPPLAVDVGVRDRFSTRNDFVGADFGLKSRFVRDKWSLDLLTRVAIGGTHQIIRGDAFTGVTFPGFPTQFVRTGRLIGPANSGVFGNDIFSAVPEIGITFGYQATSWCRLNLGYNWVYWTNVVRPGGQVDPVINPRGVAVRGEFQTDLYEPQRPGVGYNQTDIWLQTITLGMLFTY